MVRPTSISAKNLAESTLKFLSGSFKKAEQKNYIKEKFHHQLPLAVPCYDLAPVTEPTLVPAKQDF